MLLGLFMTSLHECSFSLGMRLMGLPIFMMTSTENYFLLSF
jgi:hypothetical protein